EDFTARPVEGIQQGPGGECAFQLFAKRRSFPVRCRWIQSAKLFSDTDGGNPSLEARGGRTGDARSVPGNENRVHRTLSPCVEMRGETQLVLAPRVGAAKRERHVDRGDYALVDQKELRRSRLLDSR